jgi:hypothetical protein
MATRALPVGLLLLTLLMDAEGLHQTALYVLVLALAAAVAGALSAFGDLVELPGRARGVTAARLETFSLFLGALFVLVATAARARTGVTGGVPALGVSGTVGALMALGPVLLASAVRTGVPLLRRAQAR